MSRGWSSLEPRRATGVIVRRVPVRVADISATGCMLESGLGIREGAVGTLHLTVEGRRYRETLRCCRPSVDMRDARRSGPPLIIRG